MVGIMAEVDKQEVLHHSGCEMKFSLKKNIMDTYTRPSKVCVLFISQFFMEVITYIFSYPAVGFSNLCQ